MRKIIKGILLIASIAFVADSAMAKPRKKQPKQDPKITALKKQLTKGECAELSTLLSGRAIENIDKVRKILSLDNLNMKMENSGQYWAPYSSEEKEILQKNLSKLCPRCGNPQNLATIIKSAGFSSVEDFLKFKVSSDDKLRSSIVEKWIAFNKRYTNEASSAFTACRQCGLNSRKMCPGIVEQVNGLDELVEKTTNEMAPSMPTSSKFQPTPKTEAAPESSNVDIPSKLFISNGVSIICSTAGIRVEVIYKSSNGLFAQAFRAGLSNNFASDNEINFDISGAYTSGAKNTIKMQNGESCTLTFDPEQLDRSGYIAIVVAAGNGYTYSGGSPYGLALTTGALGKVFILEENGNCYLIDKDGNKSGVNKLSR